MHENMNEMNIVNSSERRQIIGKMPLIKYSLSMMGLFVLSVFIVYITPPILSKIFFLLLLFQFARSKNNFFWFAYFFIISQGPGYFFADLSITAEHRLPLYTIMSGFSFTPLDLFVILALAKAI